MISTRSEPGAAWRGVGLAVCRCLCVVPANVKYPTGSGLLAKGVSRLVVLAGRLKAMGLAPRTKMRDRRRSMASRAHPVATWLRRRSGEAKEEVLAITEEMANIAEAALADARAVAGSSARALRRQGEAASGRAKATLRELKETAALLGTVVAQARRRVAGDMPDGSERIVSLHDKDARPIKKGRLGKPVELGRKAQVVDNSDGVVVDYEVFQGDPPDAPQLPRAIARIKARFGRAPRAATADHGYGAGAGMTVEGLAADIQADAGSWGVLRLDGDGRHEFVRGEQVASKAEAPA